MRLNQIRLCGFKSFVDATTINFPSNRVGVVGPNGCGKSNVIDAVRWVMGESSAKTLRGSAMADVIFNGSAHRKPADFAEIELVFGEADLPQFPNMEEIGIKRRLSKEGKSQYFLNGNVCRRKDITDVFLGTGLGPRSYSIIEQGMISRFIEAKPEELRNFLEEAAGISRYKERRRETELRIQHTRENMDRLNDVRLELEKQLDKLKRQARTAERYKNLKEAERVLKGQLLAMRWKTHDQEIREQENLMENHQQIFQEQAAKFADLEQRLTTHREEQTTANQRFNEVQEQFYSHQNELNRIAQTIEHSKERQEQMTLDLEETEGALHQAREDLQIDEEQATQLDEEQEGLAMSLEEQREQLEIQQQALEESQHQAESTQAAWETFQRQLHEPARQIEVERTQGRNLEQRLEEQRARLARLEQENGDLDLGGLGEELEDLAMELGELEMRLDQAHEEQDQCREQTQTQRQAVDAATREQHALHAEVQQAQGRLASLEALQESALGKSDSDVTGWLEERGFNETTPRLAQIVQVEPGWERAVETVLGPQLEALCITDLATLAERLDSLPQGRVTVVDRLSPPASANTQSIAKLADQVRSEWPIDGLLAGIYVAENLAQAYRIRSSLAAHESVITPQGLWLGPNWLAISEEMDERAGVFAREQDIARLREQIEALRGQIATLDARVAEGKDHIQIQEQRLAQVEAQIRETQQQFSRVRAEHSARQAKLEQLTERTRHLIAEQRELTNQIQADAQALEESRERMLLAEETQAEMQGRSEGLDQDRDQRRRAVEEARRQWETARDRHQQGAARQQALTAERTRLQQNLDRLHDHIAQLEEKRYELQQHQENQQPVDEYLEQHEEFRLRQETLELSVSEAKENLAHLNDTVREEEKEHRELEHQLSSFRTMLEETKLTYQGNLVRRQTVEEQLAEHEYQIEEILATLPEEATVSTWEEGLTDIERKIAKLGSINLAALEECTEQEARKKYLDEQFQDLEQAMSFLEEAIANIDAETRTRLQETLDQVNTNFQRLFPTLFGGGEAKLQPNSDDLLTAGIQIMARPLGKRNSTIHLLSGGEKALTAVALVFSIFELNPAPFCMLDEVDAPLDDTNVGRFSNLVRKMSETVQFIFISHNKIAMEMAEQLVGVTMQEPGVSRPVAVDLDLAVEMAEL